VLKRKNGALDVTDRRKQDEMKGEKSAGVEELSERKNVK